jgi:predicted CXXCH cytochrome family protein
MLKNRMDSVCYSCHVEAEIQFTKTNTHQPVRNGQCNACHRPHGGEYDNLLTRSSNDSEMCMACHAEFMQPMDKGSVHPVYNKGKCLTCHDVHGSNIPGMILKKQGFLCYSCHGTGPGTSVENTQSNHAPVVEGQCSACHSPHKAALGDLLLANYPDLCLACHTDLKNDLYPAESKDASTAITATNASQKGSSEAEGKKIYIHAEAETTNCALCHRPHFAQEQALINKPIQTLCGRCHDYQADGFADAHLGIDPAVMDCRKCHRPHTADNPLFFKSAVHPPFADKSCKDCHLVGL